MTEVKIPEGYKQTEVGVIPKDWEVEPLKSLLKEPPKYGINAAAVPLTGNLPVYIRITDISEDGYYSPEKVVGVNSPFSSSYILNEGDIVLARTGASVGKSYLYRKEDGTLIYAGFLIKVSPNEKQLNPKYLHQYLKTEQYWAWVIVNSMRSGQPGINGNEYGRLLIPLPSIEEQTAIATALSDVDNLIGSLEKLIAKKEAIKTGTMQQLLTGKTRLPEFATREDGNPKGFKQTELGRIPEDWDYKALSEMTENKGLVRGPFGGALKKDSFVRTGFKVYEQRNAIYANTEIGKYYIDKDKFNELQRFTVKPKDFIVSCSGTIGRIYQIPVSAPEGIINQALLKITLSKNTDEHFFYQIFNSKEFQESITDSTQGGAMKNLIGMSEFKKSIMLMPPKMEQTAIATILSDMDTEIQALQQRLDKTRDIKQGMMQQLLTGKVRLAH